MESIMNDTEIELYNKYKFVIQGLHTKDDFNYIMEKHNLNTKNNEKLRNVLFSYFKSKMLNNQQNIGLFQLYNLLKSSNQCVYYDDVIEQHGNLIKKVKDHLYLATISRLLKTKSSKPYEIIAKDKEKHNYITKYCPHCNHELKTSEKDKEYAVCGYLDNGYDFHGCGRDWCFKCEKKLCKQWGQDNLYIVYNRYHNSKCCCIYAKKNGDKYETDYCQCATVHVDRFKKNN